MAKRTGGTKRPPSPAAGTALVPVSATGSLTTAGGGEEPTVVRDGDVVMVSGVTYLAHGSPVPDAEAFFVDDAAPKAKGLWRGEADKIAWRDPATGYECIIMRARPGGFLGGYVGLPSSHPLHGFEADAIPADLGVVAHGGLTYSAICQDGPTPRRRVRYEARRICHVAVGYHPLVHAGDHRVEDGHAWWFGFTCDRVGDVVPDDRLHTERGRQGRRPGLPRRRLCARGGARTRRAAARNRDEVPSPARDEERLEARRLDGDPGL